MGRYYGGWGYYERKPPRKVVEGIKTKKERGEIGETWWSKRWIAVLESFSLGTRLTRGRSYARQGQVVSIDVEAGEVKAKVQGSQPKPYKSTIELPLLSDADWERVTDAMAEQAIFAAKLLAGEMPQNIEEAFSAVNVHLFPSNSRELVTDCSCPDWANPCKHIAAVYYILAERFDEDPFLIFKLRGRSKEQIIETLREKRAAALPEESAAARVEVAAAVENESLTLEESLETFWQASEALDTFVIRPAFAKEDGVDKAVLKRLGDAPYAVHGRNLTALLAKAYDEVEAAALASV